jgi:4-alpha-glucanotransferase
MNLSPEKKIAGILAPLFGLRGENDLGIGDTAVLCEFIDWAAEIGFKLVQLLPINETGPDNSPYNAISAMAIEPTTLHLSPSSPPELTRNDFDRATADINPMKLRRGAVKYSRVKKLKRALLEKAFANFSEHPSEDRQSAFQIFCARQASWLDTYVLFRALVEENAGSVAWDRWPKPQQSVESARAWIEQQSPEKQTEFRDREDFFRYVQWVGHEQWAHVKSHADKRGVALMGDIPFGVSYYSADVFSRPNEFVLDWCGGAPPEIYFKDDAFTQKWGQNWGIPLYRWDVMLKRDLDWWRERVRGVCHCFHLFRIDHVLGFYRIYSFPWRPRFNKDFLPLEWNEMLARTGGRAPHFNPRDDQTHENCQANRREGEAYLRVLIGEAGQGRLVGEDLGTVPDYVRPSLHSLGIAGFKIPQWEIYHGRITPGAEYERLSVATYATHDHKPVRALWDEGFLEPTPASDQARSELEKIAGFAEFKPAIEPVDFEEHLYPKIMEALFTCNSWIAVVMITDLLARKYRFNVPGTATSANWTRRMQRTVSQLRGSRKERARMQLIRQLLQKSGRS